MRERPPGDPTHVDPFHVHSVFCRKRCAPHSKSGPLDPRVPAVTVPKAWPCPCPGQPGAPFCLGLAAYGEREVGDKPQLLGSAGGLGL